MDQLTSTAYTAENPPSHWSDIVFLIPHEWLRRDLAAMTKSVEALPDSTTEENAWKAELFATWLSTKFGRHTRRHFESEETVYLPFMVEKGCEIQEQKISADHKALSDGLDELEKLSKAIVDAKGLNCEDEIAKLKSKIPAFGEILKAHFKEEEMTLPKLIREKITEAESDVYIRKLNVELGLEGLMVETPAVTVGLREWATESFLEKFEQGMPPPILKLVNDIFIPNHKSSYSAMRDAPTLSEKPALDQIPFDPSMLPPPPPEQAA